jgi:predicted nicotinamide N-methyase
LSASERDEEILLKIALTRDRSHAALAVPGSGLGLCGVGFDLGGSGHDNMPPIDAEHQTVIDFYQSLYAENKESVNGSARKEKESADGEEKNVNVVSSGCVDNKRKLTSRRARYQNKKSKNEECVIDPVIDMTLRNRSSLSGFLTQANSVEIISDCPFKEELINYDCELLYYPERLFCYSFETPLLLAQSYSHVGSTIWDAEVVLSHYIDNYLPFGIYDSLNRRKEDHMVIELGAGTGLASLVCMCKNFFSKVVIQDLEEVFEVTLPPIQHQLSLISQNISQSSFFSIAALWGKEAVAIIQKEASINKTSLIIMADVLYHCEHFQVLLDTIFGLLKEEGDLILSFEQRRKDVNGLLIGLRRNFEECIVHQYNIRPAVSSSISNEGEILSTIEAAETDLPRVYLCHFKKFKGK